MTDIYNFCAGPAMLPKEVMLQAQREFLDWQQQGCSVMELSHRSQVFMELAAKAEQDFRELLSVPDNYKVLFTHGGGRGQFAAVPLNLSKTDQRAAHIVSGSWSKGAVKEANKYLQADVVGEMKLVDGLQSLTEQSKWDDFSDAAYLHYCPNETVDGVEIPWIPESEDVPLVADMSSNILSKALDVSQFGVIYAGAQKNIGPSGLSVVVVREDLLGRARLETPSIFNYQLLAENESMYNTPPTYAWYLAGLVFQWLKGQGGVSAIEKRNDEKAQTLYREIDNNDFYRNGVHPDYRSRMNVPFQLADARLDKVFLAEAENAGLKALKGHRMVGGMRASIYNAMPLEGVRALVSFMHDFSRRYG